jgi:hypothetical protein
MDGFFAKKPSITQFLPMIYFPRTIAILSLNHYH